MLIILFLSILYINVSEASQIEVFIILSLSQFGSYQWAFRNKYSWNIQARFHLERTYAM